MYVDNKEIFSTRHRKKDYPEKLTDAEIMHMFRDFFKFFFYLGYRTDMLVF